MTVAGATRREQLYPEIARLRDRGLTWREIGERLGISLKTAHDYGSDPEGKSYAARQARYRATDFAPCDICGRPMTGSARRAGQTNCAACRDQRRRERRAEMVALRRAGLSNIEIAGRLGCAPHVVANALCRERRRDPSIPMASYRRGGKAAA